MSDNNQGYIHIYRKLKDDWKGKSLKTAWAWVTMVAEANWKDDYPIVGLKRGQLHVKRLTSIGWGLISWKNRQEASRFLDRCKQEKDVTTLCQARVNGVTITICDYDEYQPPCVNGVSMVCQPCDISENNSSVLRSKEVISKKKNKNIPSSDGATSENSKIYNHYLDLKRKHHKRPEWEPTEAQAKQLRVNANKLLESYKLEEIIRGLDSFSQDAFIQERGLPWNMFMKDPVSWIDYRPKTQRKTLEQKEAEFKARVLARGQKT